MKAGVYVHIPFCTRKCRYCSFVSVPRDDALSEAYLAALQGEISRFPHNMEPLSLYIGGGTPTVLPGDALAALVGRVRERFSMPEGVETTVEANPGTLGKIDLAALRRAGVNRVSLGVQSFNPAELKMLGRIHGPEDSDDAVRRLRAAGFSNIGVDLIYSLPGQRLADWTRSLERALKLGTPHISLYDLSIEEGTPLHAEFAAGRLSKPPEGLQVEMYMKAVETLEAAGYVRYEISNFALPGRECVHNLNYWSGGEYAGFGAGAFSFIGRERYANTGDVGEYIGRAGKGQSAVDFREGLSDADLRRERVMLGLRTREGVPLAASAKLATLEGAGYVARRGGRVSLTLKGVMASNAVIGEIMP